MPRLSYANVVATIALFLALTGGAVYAATKIGSKDIERGAIKAKHVKKDAVRAKHLKANSVAAAELAAGAVGAEEIADGTVGGAEVNEAGLGQVPSAADADSVGGVKVTPFAASVPFGSGSQGALLSLGGNEFRWGCGGSAASYAYERGPASSPPMLVKQIVNTNNAQIFDLAPNNGVSGNSFDSWSFEVTVHETNDRITTLDVRGFAAENAGGGTDDCFVSGELREFG
jgi:hypothetical protein